MRKLQVRKRLISISYDFNRMLEEGIKTEEIYNSLTRRLSRMKETKWQTLDWS
jgi:hypothetical protein